MLNKNNIPTGILIGALLPVISALIFELGYKDWIYFHRGMPYFAVVAANLIIIRILAKRHQDKTATGVMIVSFVFIILVYFFRYK